MGYATLADVQGLAPVRQFTTTSQPNASQVSRFIEDGAAQIDGVLLAIGYSLPIPADATQALAIARRGNTLYAWAQVEQAAPVSEDVDRANQSWTDWQESLRLGHMELALNRGNDTLARVGGVATAWFTRDMDF